MRISQILLRSPGTNKCFVAFISIYKISHLQLNKVLLMFKRINDEQLLKKNVKEVGSGPLNKLRILQGLQFKNINDSLSLHSSVMSHSKHASIKNIPNASVVSSQFSMRNSLIRSQSLEQKKVVFNKEEALQQILEKHYGRPFTKSFVQFLNKDWSLREKQFLQQKKLRNFIQSVIQRSSWLKDLTEQFLEKQYFVLGGQDRRVMTSALFRQVINSLKDLQGVIPQILKKIPDQKIYKQQIILEEIQAKLLEIYDPKCLYSNAKIKQKMTLYLQQFICKRNELKSDICTKLKPNLQFLENIQLYLSTYQKQILKIKNQLHATQNQKLYYQKLLDRKNNFTPLEIDYQKLYQIKQKTNELIRQDLNVNIVQFHQERHKASEANIARLQKQENRLRLENQVLKQEISKLNDKITDFNKNMPIFRDFGVQVYLLNQSKGSENGERSNSLISTFLQNVVTPFSFSRQITGSLLNIMSIDKVLYDYDHIRLRQRLHSFEQFLFEWFIIRTGCRKIAQIFIKNFLYSLKQLRTVHKRFAIFYRICGHSGFKKRNMQQDLEGVFFTTHLCWYYLTKLSLIYRKKLNQNPTGYHFFPPLQCEDIFKLPLRKIYEIAEQFLGSQDIQVPSDLTQLIDHYSINQISKFKSNDQQFQKETLQEIHILREINFDLIAGFLLEYVASLRCSVLEKLLRTIDSRQKQEKNILGYTQFETIYRRFYKERRAKIEQVYSLFCMINQHDILDVENARPVVAAILEDQGPLRNIFQKLEPLKTLILTEKAALMKNEKKMHNPNSYQNFRERYYHQFYDFYNTTAFLEEVFKIVKVLIKKKLKGIEATPELIQQLVQINQPQSAKRKPSNNMRNQQRSEDGDEKDQQLQKQQPKPDTRDKDQLKDALIGKLEQWGKIIVRVPHFATKILTIQQIVVHNMRRKEMIEATEFAWKTLRQILTNLGRQ